jgi:hypothetical protein
MYYQPVSAATNFELSGTITVNEYTKNNQVAFGAIVADTIKVDTYQQETYSYVAGGAFRLADINADIKDADGNVTGKNLGVASYARIDGALSNGEKVYSEDIAAGTQLKVNIKKVGDVFTVTVDGHTDTYTLPMSGDVYVGFYAARAASITVSDINFNNEVVE